MFDLEVAIRRWRRRMITGGIKSPDILDELESHLRDEIDCQMGNGVDERRAYEQAVCRLGQVAELKAEFARADRGSDAGRRRTVRTVCLLTALLMPLINIWTFVEYEVAPIPLVAGSYFLALIALYVATLPWLLERFPIYRNIRVVRRLKVVGNLLCLWPVYALLEVENVVRLHFDLGIVPTTLLWCLFTALTLTIFACGLMGAPYGGSASEGPPPPLAPKPHPIPSDGPRDVADALHPG